MEDPGAILAAQQRASESSTSTGQVTPSVDSTTAGTTSTGGALSTTTGLVTSGGTTAGLGVDTQGSTTSGTTTTTGTSTTTGGTGSTTTGGTTTTSTGGVTAGTTPKSCQDFGTFANSPIPLTGTAKPLDLAIQDGNRAWIAWGDSPAGNGTADYIYVVRADIGGTFTAVDGSNTSTGLYNATNYNLYPSIVLQSDNQPFVAWSGPGGGGDCVFASSLSSGDTWAALGTSNTSGEGIGGGKQTHGDMVVSSAVSPSGQLYVAWAEAGDSTLRLRTYTGGAWQPLGSTDTLATNAVPGNSNSSPGQIALIAPSDDAVSVAWVGSVTAGPDVALLLQWNGTSWGGLGLSGASPGIGANAGTISVDTLALATVPGTTNPAIVWTDNRAAGVENVYYEQWNGTSWAPLGNSNGSTGVSGQTQYNALRPSLGMDSSGYPAIVWQQQTATANQDQIYMRRWNGTGWPSDGNSAVGGGISNNSGSINIWPRLQMNGYVPIIAWQQTVVVDTGTVHLCAWR